MAGRFSLWPYLKMVNWGFEDQVFSMPTTTAYVRIDDQGVMRVGKSRVMLDSVVAAFTQGHSAETIQQQYPVLSLEEVYGAIAWYLANHDEVARYFERQDAIWKHWQAKADRQSSAVVQRLRALQVNKRSEPW